MDCFSRGITFPDVISNPDPAVLRSLCEDDGQRTSRGNLCFVSSVRNRSAGNTFVVATNGDRGVRQQYISEEQALDLAKQVNEYLQASRLIQVDRMMGLNPDVRAHCRLFITEPYSRIAYMWSHSLFPPNEPSESDPDLVSIYVPEWPERQIFVHPEAGITYILGTDYFGEAKKSFLRMQMYRQKQMGRIGFHAASKVLRVKDAQENSVQDVGFLIFGLSGTGKTTLSTHNHDLVDPAEAAFIRQDDVVIMDESGVCYGTEDGFYIKTEGVSEDQRVLFEAVHDPAAIFENVYLNCDGNPEFSDERLTSNGRAIIPRRAFSMSDERVDLDRVHHLVFITRRKDILPPVARLTAEQTAAYFMLGESVETSAGDPNAIGQAKREVGTNPFLIGPEADEGNRLLRFLRTNPDVQCFLLNTGSVGDEMKIKVPLSAGILEHIARGSIQWTKDPDWGYEVPTHIPEVDVEAFEPRNYYDADEYRRRVGALRKERLDWLSQFMGLHPSIVTSIEG